MARSSKSPAPSASSASDAARAPAPAPAPAQKPAKRARRKPVPKNRFALPVRAPDAAPIPDFAPVPRVYNRHDGWTPERQRAFIGALADTGCVTRAAAQVNMAQANCYTLRRAPGAEEFAAAWDAALDCGLKLLKDVAFERAIEGQLVPVFSGGKLMGLHRKRNDALLMFILRHYGEDGAGRRRTIDRFAPRAEGSRPSAGSGRTGGPDRAAENALQAFAGVALDEEARAAIMAALHDCAGRARALDAGKALPGDRALDWQAEDPDEVFVPQPERGVPWRGSLEPATQCETVELPEGENAWQQLGEAKPEALVEFEERMAAEKRAAGAAQEEG